MTTKPNVKTCPKCHGEKPLEKFMYADKLRSYCNNCERQQTKWRIARPENRLRTALKDAKRSAAKYGAVDTLTLDDLRYLFTVANGRCAYSGAFMSAPSVEHVKPLSKGGTNSVDNILIVENALNKTKKDGDPAEFIDQHYGFAVTREIIELLAARRGIDFDVVYAEFEDAQAEYSNEFYRKLIGGAGR
ncbi:HNH endonuclease [Sporosarcina aquimarina]|uniref:HNH endonuclease n=1 Tax=Sporosarcina aquimarina TaxID=114975 RepID=A0ABU4G241_9BACL|nr:hypothetical protein [Sporosarcina aquimarina]MDW0110447.1 hypothetical protein [Sporosarcina aquimarina]